jgi:YggT family protein
MIVSVLIQLINLYTMVIFVYVLMSWIPSQGQTVSQIRGVLGKICDPYLNLFRKFIPPIGGTVDISPIIAVVVLQLVMQLVVRLF